MDLCLDFLRGKYLINYSVFVHKICGAERTHRLMAAGDLLAPAAKRLQKFGGRVGDEREFQAELVGELGLSFLLVLRDAYDGISSRLKFRLMRLQRACLGRAATGVCLWVTV